MKTNGICPILTHQGLEKLHELAETHTDEFAKLSGGGIQGMLGKDDFQTTPLRLKQKIALPIGDNFSFVDDADLSEQLHRALPELTPRQIVNRLVPCSIAVFLLGPYSRYRWRDYEKDPIKYVRRHSLAGYGSHSDYDLYHTVARLYHLNRITELTSGGNRDKRREILEMICDNPDSWHRIYQRRYLASNTRAVTAFIDLWSDLVSSGRKPKRQYMESLVREYNKRAAGIFVDQLDDDEVRHMVRSCAPADGTIHAMLSSSCQESIYPSPVARILSLGGGIQSTTMALMATNGEFAHKPDYAIFADTGWEPSYVYETIDCLESMIDFPILRVGRGRSLGDDVFYGEKPSGSPGVKIPVHLQNAQNSAGMMKRECTSDYKIEPIRKKARELIGIGYRQRVMPRTSIEMWLGITKDEAQRVKPSRETYIQHRYPLIEEKNLDRNDCAQWLRDNYPDLVVRKSACIGCPYRGARAWVEVKRDDPEGFSRAIEIDKRIREPEHPWVNLLDNEAYLHSRRIPLDKAVMLDEEQLSEGINSDNPDFIDACEGLCGT